MSDPVATLHRLLLRSRQTIAIAESITGGHVQTLLTASSGASAYFLGGITAYALHHNAV